MNQEIQTRMIVSAETKEKFTARHLPNQTRLRNGSVMTEQVLESLIIKDAPG
eukprot:TRINITY_DN3091_c0_g1_i1.p2 TRINITY_DN3091_c0_g1~~TRINITY_DN3091_c0_g1_i1.p2  ORF type:complete len:52 (+),score=4.10 TRINITY_DN3091_c0_g1_i1:138-293(+)